MPLSIRHRNDSAPKLAPVRGLTIAPAGNDPHVMAAVQQRHPDEMKDRFDAGHRAYLAHLHDEVAAWGWVATRAATIGELGLRFRVPRNERYLWNFVTRPAHRGKGIYPRLLQGIVTAEPPEADRFWIIHAPENRASGSGIRKAGFVAAGEISFDPRNRPALHGVTERAGSAPDLLDLPVSPEPLAPCWRCARAGRRWVMFCAPGTCRCDYQEPHAGCGS